MIEVVSLKASHIVALRDVGALTYLSDLVTPESLSSIETLPQAFTMLDDGIPIACAGLIEIWKGRAEAWAFFDPRIGPSRFLAVHRSVLRFFDLAQYRRIEAVVDCGFEPGHRWVKMLGFKMEAERMTKYTVVGGDVVLYARIKGDI